MKPVVRKGVVEYGYRGYHHQLTVALMEFHRLV
jgi:hypothetical protein